MHFKVVKETYWTDVWIDSMALNRFSSLHNGHYEFIVHHFVHARTNTHTQFEIRNVNSNCVVWSAESSTESNHTHTPSQSGQSIKNMHNYYSLNGICTISNAKILNLSKNASGNVPYQCVPYEMCTHKWICLQTFGRSFVCLAGWLADWRVGWLYVRFLLATTAHNSDRYVPHQSKNEQNSYAIYLFLVCVCISFFLSPFCFHLKSHVPVVVVRIFLFIYIMQWKCLIHVEVHWCLIQIVRSFRTRYVPYALHSMNNKHCVVTI